MVKTIPTPFYCLACRKVEVKLKIEALMSWFWQVYPGCCPLLSVFFNDVQLNSWRSFFLKSIRYLSLESVFVSLNKSVLLHRRCSMLKFSEMLILVCRKIFSAFYILHETFSNSYGFPLMQEFNPFYPHSVLYDRKHFCSVLTDLGNLLILFDQKFPMIWRKFLQNSSLKCITNRLQMLFRSSRPKVFLEISQNSLENTRTRVSLWIKLQALASVCIFIKKETLAQVFSYEFCEISKNSFSLTEHLWWLLLVLQNRCS